MRAAQLSAFGPTDELRIVDVPIPTPRRHEILIEVAFAGLLFADILLRSGTYQRFRYDLPVIPGHEVVGTVIATGADVQELKVGMRVSAELTDGGGFAEYACADPLRVVELPESVAFEQAIVYSFNLPAAFLIYNNFVPIPSEATVLIHSGAGGLGSMLTQIAKRSGNQVIVTVSDPGKRDACLSYGADHVIDTSQADYVNEVQSLTDGRGVDVAFNHMGRETSRDWEVLTFRGLWILMNSQAVEGLTHAGKQFHAWATNYCPTMVVASSATLYGTDEHRTALNYLHSWLDNEALDLPSRTYALDDIADAQNWMESRQSTGKIAIAL